MASPSANVVLGAKPLYLQGTGSPGNIQYDANADRKWFEDFLQQGVRRSGHLNVTFVSGLTVRVAGPGIAYVLGQDITDQGMYRQQLTGNVDIAVGAGHATLPRIDQVVLRIFDDRAQANTLFEGRIEVIPGTPTAAADLTNLNGQADLTTLTGPVSKSVLRLAYVLVPIAAANLTSTAANILDARTRVMLGNQTDVLVDPFAMAQRGALDGQVVGYDTAVGRTAWLNPVPIGAIIDYAGMVVPTGFYFCDGTTKNRVTEARLFNALTLLTTGNTHTNTTLDNLPSTTEIAQGMKVEGTGIPAGATVASVDSATQVTLSAAATSTVAGLSVRFFAYGNGDGSTTFNLPDGRGRVTTGQGTHVDVDKVGDNDGLAVGSRAPSQHTHPLTQVAAFGAGTNTATQAGVTGVPTNFPYLTVKKIIRAS